MQMKDAYKRKLDPQLLEWNTQISQLVIKVERAGADLKLKYAREINEIRAKQREVADKIKELEDASGDTWVKVKVAADKSWDELRTGLALSISRFR